MKPKIAVIGLKGLPAFGGAATVGEHLISQLKDDFDFTVYSVSSHASERKMTGYKQIIFKKNRFRRLNIFLYILKSLAHALVSQYDLIHIHHGSNGFITPILRIRFKVVLTLHGIYRDSHSDSRYNLIGVHLLKWFQWLNIIFSSKIISVSSDDASYLNKRHNCGIITIPNGVKIMDVKATLPEKKFIVFAAGRIYNIKGLHLILEAMRLNRDQIELRIIGDFDKAYESKIKELSSNLNLTFIPLIRDKEKLFAQIKGAQFFIFPSLSEAMSMMLLEVASLKVPVIASDIAANTSVFSTHEVLFFESGSSTSLAEKMRFAENNTEAMCQMAGEAYRKVTNVYTWEVIGQKYKEVFEDLIQS